jgi:hypothetical protein
MNDIDVLNNKIAILEKRVAFLERSNNSNTIYGPIPDYFPKEMPVIPPLDTKNINTCSKCGIQVNRIMMYSCQQMCCPSGLGSYALKATEC